MRRPPEQNRQDAEDQAGERQGLAADLRSGLALRAGDLAPAFRLGTPAGDTLSLADMLKRGPAVLSFLDGDGAAAAGLLGALQAAAGEIAAAGAAVLVLSPAAPGGAPTRRGLHLLHDAASAVAQAYGLCETQDGPVPATFVVDRDARILMSLTHAASGGAFIAANVVSTLKALRRRRPPP